jgi:tryptophan synthase alpha chain
MKAKTIRNTILEKGNNILNVYFTAGHPNLESTVETIHILKKLGVDLIELGMPYSDPLADGPTIQKSSEIALKNGQSISLLFQQVTEARKTNDIPIIVMGYFNQMVQYGVERFLSDASNAGIQGLIIPDLPMVIYEKEYESLFHKYKIEISFLVTPMTSDLRIKDADRLSSGFLYVVSQSSITGKQSGISEEQINYFKKIQAMPLSSPSLIGFGIHDKKTREMANQYSHGAIVGSAFIRVLESAENRELAINTFIRSLE